MFSTMFKIARTSFRSISLQLFSFAHLSLSLQSLDVTPLKMKTGSSEENKIKRYVLI